MENYTKLQNQHSARYCFPTLSVGILVAVFLILGVLHQPGITVDASLPQFCNLETIRIEMEQSLQTGTDRMRCRGNVTLTICEGQCVSSAVPSVVSKFGFVKKCSCCRETKMQSTRVQLAHCVNEEGTCVENFVHEMSIQEPSTCACQSCGP